MPLLRNPGYEKALHNFITGMDGGASWTAAGYKATGNTAQVKFSRMFKRPDVRERYAELMAPRIEATGLTVERVLEELQCLAYYDMTAILEHGNGGKITFRDPTLLPKALRRAIVGIKPTQVGDVLHYECKFADKQRALESLARHLQMFKDTVIVENVFRIVTEMDDDELDRRLTELERAYRAATTLDSAAREGPEGIH